MYTLTALIAVAAVCVLARPPVPAAQATGPAPIAQNPAKESPENTPANRPNTLDEYIIPHIQPAPFVEDYQDVGLEELYQEISYIDQLGEDLNDNLDESLFMYHLAPSSVRTTVSRYMQRYHQEFKRDEEIALANPPMRLPFTRYQNVAQETVRVSQTKDSGLDRVFAITPLQAGYFDAVEQKPAPKAVQETHQDTNATIDPRQTRQNPNLSRAKTLVASNLGKLRVGFSEEPITSRGTDQPDQVLINDPESRAGRRSSFYSIALVMIVGSGVAILVVGFMVGLFKISKRAKAAADVDYPAYGVTGPTTELSGDRKLAHSAHLYHYQHQKQILALESCNNDQRTASVSEPESEDENEEGDYTVYECPGFATTGEMEVKNPMFSEDQTTPGKAQITPVTPEKIELTIVKPQPTD